MAAVGRGGLLTTDELAEVDEDGDRLQGSVVTPAAEADAEATDVDVGLALPLERLVCLSERTHVKSSSQHVDSSAAVLVGWGWPVPCGDASLV